MSGSKRRRDKRNRRLSHILGFAAVGLAIAGLIWALRFGGCI